VTVLRIHLALCVHNCRSTFQTMQACFWTAKTGSRVLTTASRSVKFKVERGHIFTVLKVLVNPLLTAVKALHRMAGLLLRVNNGLLRL